jgi:hypothetical protein
MKEWKIPVFIDSVKDFEEALMMRCTYFFIDFDEATVAPIAEPQDLERPALIMGGREIVMSPSQSDLLFDSSEIIEGFFKAVEKEEYQSIEVGVLWIPLPPGTKGFFKKNMKELRGQVFRLPQVLYEKCYMYTLNRISLKEFLADIAGFNLQDFRSPKETKAFGDWMEKQIKNSKKRVDDLKEKNYRALKSESKGPKHK